MSRRVVHRYRGPGAGRLRRNPGVTSHRRWDFPGDNPVRSLGPRRPPYGVGPELSSHLELPVEVTFHQRLPFSDTPVSLGVPFSRGVGVPTLPGHSGPTGGDDDGRHPVPVPGPVSHSGDRETPFPFHGTDGSRGVPHPAREVPGTFARDHVPPSTPPGRNPRPGRDDGRTRARHPWVLVVAGCRVSGLRPGPA